MVAPLAARGPLGLGPGPEAIVRAVAASRRGAKRRFRLVFVLTWVVLVGAIVLLIGSTGRVDLDFLQTWSPLILGGIPITIAVSVISIVFATIFAIVFAIVRLSLIAPIYAAATLYV
jgi:ABC-type amino acid transport system permease subunit